MNRSSEFEFHWIRWKCIPVFFINEDVKYLNDLNDSMIDLPNLKFIELGKYALEGRPDSSCSLWMEGNIIWMNWFLDLPNLTSITSNGCSFRCPHSVTLSSLILNDCIMNRYSESSNSWSSWFIQFDWEEINWWWYWMNSVW